MSHYPGNISLSAAVRERVLSTFQQTVALFQSGRTDEAVSGCNLILQMDPQFDPARKLLEKVRNPSLPIDISQFMNKAPRGSGGDMDEARAAFAARDFERAIQITTDILTNDLMNDEARILSDEAREKMEAGPFVDQFARKCEQHIAAGNLSAARADLEKAKALDPAHPALARVQKLLADKESAPASFDASSFVVDAPAAPATAGRGTAQASDFGFTFEEEKTPAAAPSDGFANFSFDSPAAPAAPAPTTPQSNSGGFASFSFDGPIASPAPAPPPPPPAKSGNEFDFSTASIETSPDDQKKVEQYLADGDRAFESGGYQQAIDLWSRIFLIDVTNEAASERIERAKAKRREADQKLEGVLAAGIAALERRDTMTARAKFNEVLQIDPNNSSARDYMAQIESGDAGAMPPPEQYKPLLDEEPLDFPDVAVPPDPTAAPARAARSAPAPASRTSTGRKAPVGAIAAVLGLLALAAGGWFVWSKFMSSPGADSAATRGTIERATSLSQQGQYDQAIALLQDVRPGDPQYDTALAMIADMQAKKARAATVIEGKPSAEYWQENVDAARAAFDARDFAGAKRGFENAMRVKSLPPELKASYDTAAQQVAKLDTARALFAERKYSDALSSLEPLLRQEPNNPNIRRMISDAHFNMGLMALQDERLQDAVREFDEVLKENPNDELAKRSRELAIRYDGEQKDLLYRIYVKYLPLRQPQV